MDVSNFGLTFGAVVVVTFIQFDSCLAEECDLSDVEKCVGTSSQLIPKMYFKPLESDLLLDITHGYCNKGIEACLVQIKGNCSETNMAPYKTIVDIVTYVCQTDMSEHDTCILEPRLQHEYGFCFSMFKVVFDNVVSDATLTSEGINKGLCSAYDDVFSCCMAASGSACDVRSQTYIESLLLTATQANRNVLGC